MLKGQEQTVCQFICPRSTQAKRQRVRSDYFPWDHNSAITRAEGSLSSSLKTGGQQWLAWGAGVDVATLCSRCEPHRKPLSSSYDEEHKRISISSYIII